MRDVSCDVFQSFMDSNIRINDCPHCGYPVEVRVYIPKFGPTGTRVICPHCKVQTAMQGINICIAENGTGRLGTPIVPESLLEGIMKAIKIWNGESDETDGT